MKLKKSAGPDDITAEHLKYEGETGGSKLCGKRRTSACISHIGYYRTDLNKLRQGPS